MKPQSRAIRWGGGRTQQVLLLARGCAQLPCHMRERVFSYCKHFHMFDKDRERLKGRAGLLLCFSCVCNGDSSFSFLFALKPYSAGTHVTHRAFPPQLAAVRIRLCPPRCGRESRVDCRRSWCCHAAWTPWVVPSNTRGMRVPLCASVWD